MNQFDSSPSRKGIAQEVFFAALEAIWQAPKMLCSPGQASQECPITWSAWMSLFLFKLSSQLMDNELLSPKWKARAKGGWRVKELSSYQPWAVNRRAGIYLPEKRQRWGQHERNAKKLRDWSLPCHKMCNPWEPTRDGCSSISLGKENWLSTFL